jgi:hypothetical protein
MGGITNMSGVGRPGHWMGKVVSNVEGQLVIEAKPEDVEYLEAGKHYDFDVTPVGGDPGGENKPEA